MYTDFPLWIFSSFFFCSLCNLSRWKYNSWNGICIVVWPVNYYVCSICTVYTVWKFNYYIHTEAQWTHTCTLTHSLYVTIESMSKLTVGPKCGPTGVQKSTSKSSTQLEYTETKEMENGLGHTTTKNTWCARTNAPLPISHQIEIVLFFRWKTHLRPCGIYG